jgi:hypothetical protein
MGKFIDRTGEENCNTFGTLMKVIECKSAVNIIVEFQDDYKYKKKCAYKEFKNGNVKNPYDREVYGVGYYGKGKYKARREDGKTTRVYTVWHNMIKRCYDPYELNRFPTYINCYVCKEWHNFQNFAEWWEENVYNCNNERICLDKDILCKGNKIYSPDTCVLVPERINILFIKSDAKRGEYPIGVTYHKTNDKLMVQCNVHENGKSKQRKIGFFPLNRPFQAFYAYKTFKEKYIKQIAEEYKELIPEKLYEAMYKYEVEIND